MHYNSRSEAQHGSEKVEVMAKRKQTDVVQENIYFKTTYHINKTLGREHHKQLLHS